MDSICIETELKNVLRYLSKHIVMMEMMIIVVVDVVRRFREMAVVIDERQHYNEKNKADVAQNVVSFIIICIPE